MSGLNEIQLKNYEFFEAKLAEYLKNPLLAGKYVIIQNETLINSYDSFDLAINTALSNYSPEEFIIQQVIDESSTINFLYSAKAV